MINNIFKVKLYILSLALLFLIVFIMTVKIPDFKYESYYVNDTFNLNVFYTYLKQYLLNLITSNKIPLLMLVLMLISWYIKHEFDYLLSGGGEQVIRVQNIQSEDYEHLTFLATYIIPFFGFTFDDPRRLLAYTVLLIIIGVMFIKTDKYYANPTLSVLGFKLYKATLADNNGIYDSVILISKDNIVANDVVKYKLISKNVFFIKKSVKQ
ncbi:anti-phage protein KwaA [Photobacterium sp. DNB22_13_2]